MNPFRDGGTMRKRLGPQTGRRRSKQEEEMVNSDGRPLEPPRPNDIEGRPSVGWDDPLLDALIKEHPERDPVNIKREDQ
jgi:hypothetical protein